MEQMIMPVSVWFILQIFARLPKEAWSCVLIKWSSSVYSFCESFKTCHVSI